MIDFGVVEPVFCILFATNFFGKILRYLKEEEYNVKHTCYFLFCFFFCYPYTFAFINPRPYYKICDFQHQKIPFFLKSSSLLTHNKLESMFAGDVPIINFSLCFLFLSNNSWMYNACTMPLLHHVPFLFFYIFLLSSRI